MWQFQEIMAPTTRATGQKRKVEAFSKMFIEAMENDMLIPPDIDENPDYWNVNKICLSIMNT